MRGSIDGESLMTDIDINKAMEAEQSGADMDKAARSHEIVNWSKEAASQMAKDEGIELGDQHWKVIEFLRSTYVDRGKAPHARYLASLLNDAFEAQGGSKYLYQLFPGGPVSQGSRLAGVPVPHDARDLSFGSSY